MCSSQVNIWGRGLSDLHKTFQGLSHSVWCKTQIVRTRNAKSYIGYCESATLSAKFQRVQFSQHINLSVYQAEEYMHNVLANVRLTYFWHDWSSAEPIPRNLLFASTPTVQVAKRPSNFSETVIGELEYGISLPEFSEWCSLAMLLQSFEKKHSNFFPADTSRDWKIFY